MIGAAQKDFSMLNDQQLKQAMMFAQRSNNTPEFLGLMAEANKRKQMRSAAQGQQAGQDLAQGPRTQADAVMSGIANLSASSDEQGYAGGGIVSFDDGGLTLAQKTPTAVGSGYAVYKGAKYSLETLRQLAALQGTTLSKMLAADAGTAASAAAPVAVPAAVAAGGAGLSALGANYLNRLPDESLDMLTEAGGDTGFAAAILRNANRDMSNSPAPTAKKPTPPTPARKEAQDRPYINPKAFNAYQPETPPAKTPAADDTGGVATLIKNAVGARTQAPGAGFTPTKADTTPTKIDVASTPDAAARMAEAKKLAAEDNEGISSIYKRMADRDAKKMAELDAETGEKKGWLGMGMSPALREALLRGGIAAMSTKRADALGGIGEAFGAGADAYKAGETRRKDARDKLDEAADKRALAEIEAKKGNMDRSRQFMSDADTAQNNAFSQALHKAQIGQEDKKLLEMARGHDLTYMAHLEQMANQLKVAGITASSHLAAAKLPAADVQIVERMMKDPKFAETYKELMGIKTGAKSNDVLVSKWSSDPSLQLRFPTFEQYKAAVGAGDYVTAPAKGDTVVQR